MSCSFYPITMYTMKHHEPTGETQQRKDGAYLKDNKGEWIFVRTIHIVDYWGNNVITFHPRLMGWETFEDFLDNWRREVIDLMVDMEYAFRDAVDSGDFDVSRLKEAS